jgi:hypothetical protein
MRANHERFEIHENPVNASIFAGFFLANRTRSFGFGDGKISGRAGGGRFESQEG